jgi:hypothetical protein
MLMITYDVDNSVKLSAYLLKEVEIAECVFSITVLVKVVIWPHCGILA